MIKFRPSNIYDISRKNNYTLKCFSVPISMKNESIYVNYYNGISIENLSTNIKPLSIISTKYDEKCIDLAYCGDYNRLFRVYDIDRLSSMFYNKILLREGLFGKLFRRDQS